MTEPSHSAAPAARTASEPIAETAANVHITPAGAAAPTRPLKGEEVLRVEDLTVGFPTEDGIVQAVRGVSYTLREREVLGIVGESGSGKSVSSMAVMGLLPKSARITGTVLLPGQGRAARCRPRSSARCAAARSR